MKSSIGLLVVAVLLGACASEHKFTNDPEHYALFVATTNVYVDAPLRVQNTQTGQQYDIRTNHLGGTQTGYLMASLPPGRYELLSYVLDGASISPLGTPNGWFEVQANCFNYGGAYDFELTEAGAPTYTNTTSLKDIENLPSHYRDFAQDRDICAAGMGKPGERLSAADVKGQLVL